MKIEIEPQLRVLFPPGAPVSILVVGLGGTGSALALSLARLVYHARQKGMKLEVTFCDHDLVEERNVGRQYFAPCDAGRPKAEVMAEWINHDWGLDIRAAVLSFNEREWNINAGAVNVMVGCVDNVNARRAMSRLTHNANGRLWWLDCGNDNLNGQILIGNRKRGSVKIAAELGLAHDLPYPASQAPDLTREPRRRKAKAKPVDPSCADLTLADEQGLHVNQAMAVYAAQYIYDIVIRRQLTTFATYVSLDPPAARSLPITAGHLVEYLAKEKVAAK